MHIVVYYLIYTICCIMSWTEEKVNKLKELWGKGNTASQIAEIIGGISRNAVIGKAHRLNLSAKIKTRQHTNYKKILIQIKILNLLKKVEKVGLDLYFWTKITNQQKIYL